MDRHKYQQSAPGDTGGWIDVSAQTAQGEIGVQEYRDLSGCPGEMPGYLFSLKDSCLLLQALSSILSTIKRSRIPRMST